MSQTINKSANCLRAGDFIDLTDEIDTRNVLDENDDIFILDTSKPVEDLTHEINNKLESLKNKPSQSVVTKTAPAASSKPKAAPLDNEPGKPTRLVINNPKPQLNVKSPTVDTNLARIQLTNSVNKQILKTTNSKNVYLLQKPVPASSDGVAKPVEIDSLIEVSDRVLAPSSSEIRNKKFPTDPLAPNDDDVIFVKNVQGPKAVAKVQVDGKKLTPISVKAPSSHITKTLQKGAQNKITNPKNTFQNVVVKTASTTVKVNNINKPRSDKKQAVLPQTVSKITIKDPFSRNEGEESEAPTQNWSNAKVYQKKAPEPKYTVTSIQKKSPNSQIVIQNVYSESTGPVKINQTRTNTAPQTTQRQHQSSISNRSSDDDDIICLSDISEKTVPPKISPVVSFDPLFQTKNISSAPTKKSSGDIEKVIPANSILKTIIHDQTSLNKALEQIMKDAKGKVNKLPEKRIILNQDIPASQVVSNNLADIVETASAVANITPGAIGEVLPDASKKGTPLVFLLYPLDPESGETVPLKEGHVNQVLALVPTDSNLAPPQLTPFITQHVNKVRSQVITFDDCDSLKEVEPEFKTPNLPHAKEKNLVLKKPPKKVEIETPAVFTPVDITQILNRGKKKELPGTCRNNEIMTGIYLKGFRKRKTSSCIAELKHLISKEVKHINTLKKSLKRYESNFVFCGSATNYFLPETVKIEEPEEVDCHDVFEDVDDTTALPSISEVISKVNEEVLQMKSKRGQGRVEKHTPNLSKTEEALKLIKQGLEMIQNWSQENGESSGKNDESAVPTAMKRGKERIDPIAVVEEVQPQSSAPVMKKRRGRRKEIVSVREVVMFEDKVEPPPVKRRRRRKEEIEAEMQSTGVVKRRPKAGVQRIEKGRKNVSVVDDSDDLMVVKRVHIIKDGGPIAKVRRRKQTFL